MKSIFTFLFTAIIFTQGTVAQITVDDNDFASANDKPRMSVAVWNPLLDFGATDTNYVWDFSNLQWQSQFVDTFLNSSFVNPIYTFTFSNLPFNPYQTNIAKRADNSLTTIPILSSIFTDGYNFYFKNSSLYRQKGLGMKVSGFPTAVPMKHADTLYHFPMNFGDADSSWSDYTVRIPQLGTYSHQQHRVNTIDGWGTLTTPFGTFDALRVKTDIRGSDSLYIDTLNFGFNYVNDIQREYKWFGKNQMEPLLQINTQAGILGQFQTFEFVTKVIYRDSLRLDPNGIFETENNVQLNVFPNPSNGLFYISAPENVSKATITLSDINGRTLLLREMQSPTEILDASMLTKGVYILILQSKEGNATKKIVVH